MSAMKAVEYFWKCNKTLRRLCSQGQDKRNLFRDISPFSAAESNTTQNLSGSVDGISQTVVGTNTVSTTLGLVAALVWRALVQRFPCRLTSLICLSTTFRQGYHFATEQQWCGQISSIIRQTSCPSKDIPGLSLFSMRKKIHPSSSAKIRFQTAILTVDSSLIPFFSNI
jgi:hypothetical protein